MQQVIIYTKQTCPYCTMAKNLLKQKGVTEIQEIRVDLDPEELKIMMEKTSRRTVPQIFIGDTHVGGFDDLAALEKAGKLSNLLD